MNDKSARSFDVVVWGATGFTGRLVAEYLVRHHGVGGGASALRWAIGGRNRAKLEGVRAELEAIDPGARDLAVLVGDGQDAASLAPIVASTRVVLTTVGPYAVHGHAMVAACVEHGTDYVDLTGEPQFVRASIDRHEERARATGARIVHCCGFDSIPSDLGTLLLQTTMQQRYGSRCAEVKYFLKAMKGGMSGGTIASALNIAEETTRDPSVKAILDDPYALDPGRGAPGPDAQDQIGVRWDRDLDCWTGPFMMAAINTRIVRRSNAVLDYAWGRDFRYSECARFGAGPAGMLAATGLSVGFGAFFAAALFAPTRALLGRVLPAPGEGPSKEARDSGFFVVQLVGIGEGDPRRAHRLLATVKGDSDPGYGETAKMISESALCLAKDDVRAGGGILTPASCMGMPLVDRLRRAGMTFDVATMPSR